MEMVLPQKRTPVRTARPAVWLVAIVVFGLLPRAVGLRHNIDGNMLTRQAHIASNVYFFLRDGITIPTRTFNKRYGYPDPDARTLEEGMRPYALQNPSNLHYRIYDFPLYQMIAALFCRLTGADILLVCRLMNLVLYALFSGVLYAIMRRTKVPPAVALCALFVLAISPLQIFYSHAVHPDNLAVLLSYLSLLFFLRRQDPSSRTVADGVFLFVTGILAALIKSPCHLPVVVAMLCYTVAMRRGRRLMLAYGAALLLTLVSFKLYMNLVNTGSLRSPAFEHVWFFSTLKERLNLEHNRYLILRTIGRLVNPLLFLASLAGLALYIRRARRGWIVQEQSAIYLGLALGAFLTVVIFHQLNFIHDYYQLPFVFPASFFAAYGLAAGWERLSGASDAGGKSQRPARGYLAVAALVVLGAATSYFARIQHNQWNEVIEAGHFIEENTPENGFVFYMCPSTFTHYIDDFVQLYFARREGYNINRCDLPQEFARVHALYAVENRPFYLFSPDVEYAKYRAQIEALHVQMVAHGPDGSIFRLR
jgi:hypothetical protein